MTHPYSEKNFQIICFWTKMFVRIGFRFSLFLVYSKNWFAFITNIHKMKPKGLVKTRFINVIFSLNIFDIGDKKFYYFIYQRFLNSFNTFRVIAEYLCNCNGHDTGFKPILFIFENIKGRKSCVLYFLWCDKKVQNLFSNSWRNKLFNNSIILK